VASAIRIDAEMDFLPSEANNPIMLRFRQPPVPFVCFLLVVVGLGAATGYLVDAVGVAAFFFVASIDAKPAWKYWFDPARRARGGETMARAARSAPRAVPNKRLGERPGPDL
jgi:hypothetical protein